MNLGKKKITGSKLNVCMFVPSIQNRILAPSQAVDSKLNPSLATVQDGVLANLQRWFAIAFLRVFQTSHRLQASTCSVVRPSPCWFVELPYKTGEGSVVHHALCSQKGDLVKVSWGKFCSRGFRGACYTISHPKI